MPRVAHVVVTGAFAGVERYVCTVAAETARRGWDVTVIGGDPVRMPRELGPAVRWRPGSTAAQAAASLLRTGRLDVCHAHMTIAEAVAVGTRRWHRGRVVSTRHFAAPRGASRLGAALSPWIAGHLSCEIAISRFVAGRVERPPGDVVLNGVRESPVLWRVEQRVVLVVQRLEREKDTATALQAWGRCGLAHRSWRLRIVGDGSQRPALEGLAQAEGLEGVEFAGQQPDVAAEYARAGLLLATSPVEGLGLSVVEAMAAGVPVVAAAAGGHLETIGQVPGAVLFVPGDADDAARVLSELAERDDLRAQLSREVRAWQRQHATAAACVDGLLARYDVETLTCQSRRDPIAR